MYQALQADLIHHEIKEELKDARFFSFRGDCSTDKVRKTQEATNCTLVDKVTGKPK